MRHASSHVSFNGRLGSRRPAIRCGCVPGEKRDAPANATSEHTGLQEPQYQNAKKTFTNRPAPVPDMTSPAMLAAEPKSQREHQPIPAEARAARAEAPAKKVRVEASARKA